MNPSMHVLRMTLCIYNKYQKLIVWVKYPKLWCVEGVIEIFSVRVGYVVMYGPCLKKTDA